MWAADGDSWCHVAGLLQKKAQDGLQTTMEATLMAQQTPAQREQVHTLFTAAFCPCGSIALSILFFPDELNIVMLWCPLHLCFDKGQLAANVP